MKGEIKNKPEKRKKESLKTKKKITQEQKGSRFYACGFDVRSQEAGGFLSFGYWDEGVLAYHTAVKRLIRYIFDNSRIIRARKILNVACGFFILTDIVARTYC